MGTKILPKDKSTADLRSRSSQSIAVDSRLAAFAAANAAEIKKGQGTLVLDVSQITLLADYFVISGASSPNQVRAIAEAIGNRLNDLGYPMQSIEGKREGRWVLLDYGDVIVHVLQEKERSYYKLEQFWNNALIVDPRQWQEADL